MYFTIISCLKVCKPQMQAGSLTYRKLFKLQNNCDYTLSSICSALLHIVHYLPLFLLSYRIISVHLTASCSSISLSLYWFLSIRTLAISTLVKRFLWAVGTSLCWENTSTRAQFNIYTYHTWHMLILAFYLNSEDQYDGYGAFWRLYSSIVALA